MSSPPSSLDPRAVMLKVQGLSYGTVDERPLIRDLSLTVRQGQIVTVTGPNGIGKSTLLKILTAEHPRTAGSIDFHVPRSEVIYLSQLHNREFHVPLTLRDVLRFARSRHEEQPGLLTADQLPRLWNTASGGERQKTLLTKALQDQGRLLLLDEPMNHLDVQGRQVLRQALEQYVFDQRRAVLMICHEKALKEDGWRHVETVDLRRYVCHG